MSNRLAGETSPYLLQHAGNPVHWQPWDAAALAAARVSDKPILLSIGYSACHWCHVMAHESFEDAAVAAVMNELFVNIKVDREERPDLDQIYQTAHQMLTGRPGGWPLTMFLLADGTPFFGGTYFPKTPRYQLPGFPDLCRQIENVYRTRRGDIEQQNRSLRAMLDGTLPETGTALPPAALLESATANLLRNFDPRYGGFGGAPKFPQPTDLAFLLRRAVTTANRDALAAVATTLTRMAEGGLFDQIGGGFCRYSVDAQWEIPHFEKMLYDNGPLLALYADAWAAIGDPLYARIAEETAAWAMREMQSPEGGYASSLDADSEGEEGRFYVWDRAEVRSLLGADAWRVAAPHWGLGNAPNFEGRWHLKVDRPLAEADRPLLAAARRTLFAARERRVRPGRDDKILTRWNALMIQGMAHAARVFGRDDWLASARRALEFIRGTLWRNGRLLATYKDGKTHLAAYLDDYAFLLNALLELLQTDFRNPDLAFARQLAEALLDHFEDGTDGGFFFTAHDHETLIHRPKPGRDNATPSGNGVAAFALQRLGHLLGDARYLAAAERTLRLFGEEMARLPSGFSTLLDTLDEAVAPPGVAVLRGPRDRLRPWQTILNREPLPRCLILALPNGLDALPPALDKPASAAVNAWLCCGVHCSSPEDDIHRLLEAIRNPHQGGGYISGETQ